MRLGGFGLRSADRTAPAACGASWADAMPMLSRRLPELTTHIIDEMARGPQGCLSCRSEHNMCTLGSERFHQPPRWPQLRAGETTSSTQHRAWRVAAWLAISRVFLGPVMFRRPGSFAIALRPRNWRGSYELPRDQSSGLNPSCSLHWCWSCCVSRWTSQSRNASVDVSLTQLEGTGQPARHLADSAQEQSVPKRLWPECAGRTTVHINT